MSQIEDPSIISLVPASTDSSKVGTQGNSENHKEDNAITKFLREAEYKREEEESKRSTPSIRSEALEPELEQSEDTKAQLKVLELESWKLDLGPYVNTDRLRYSMDYLFSLKDSTDNIVPKDLPPKKSYYRLKNKPVQRTNWTGNQYNNNNNSNYNGRYNEGGPATGSMGNFSLNKKTHERGFNRYGGNNNRRNNRDNRHKKHGDEDDSWLAELEKDEPAGGSAEDFEKWKAKMKLAERKRKGEVVDENENSSGSQRSEGNKNTIDSFFSVAKPKSGGSSNVGTPDVGKNSKFFSFFKPESAQSADESTTQSTPGNDGVSKILSLLDSGEKNAQAGSSNTTPQLAKASPSQTSQSQAGPTQQQARSQFSFQHPIQGQQQQQLSTVSPAANPILPPGLAPPPNQGPPGLAPPSNQGGSKDSFFMSLLSKSGPEQVSEAGRSPALSTQSPKVSQESKNSPATDQSRPQLPPGLQGPPGLPQQPQQQQQQQQQQPQQQLPQGSQGQPMIPPQFQNGNNRGQGQMPPVPPGFNPQQPPPWLAQQFPPNLPQGGRFMPPPPPSGVGFPPQIRQNGLGPSNIPPHLLYGQPGQGQNSPPMFYPPFGAPGNPNTEVQQREQQRFPPGFFNGPPPPGFQMRDPNQQ